MPYWGGPDSSRGEPGSLMASRASRSAKVRVTSWTTEVLSRRWRLMAMGRRALVGLSSRVLSSYASVPMDAKKMPEVGRQSGGVEVKHIGTYRSLHGLTGSLRRKAPLEGIVVGVSTVEAVMGTQGSHGSRTVMLSQTCSRAPLVLPTSVDTFAVMKS